MLRRRSYRVNPPNPTIGVCSWSLRPDLPQALVSELAGLGISTLQLHLDPIRLGQWNERELVDRLDAAGISLVSGMMTTQGEDYTTLESIAQTGGVRPDTTWPANLAAARANAEAAQRLGLPLVTLHAGHLPADIDDPLASVMIDRLGALTEEFAGHGVRVAFETGQETAATLLRYLKALPNAGVNFDPANMILYAMGDPHEALEQLAHRVLQLHIKDALPTTTPGLWGTEVPVGKGAVDWPRLLAIYRQQCPDAGLVIEREAGESRADDIARAATLVQSVLEKLP